MAFIKDLWDSIFVPGTTPALVKATHLTFSALVATLLWLLYATKSLHFVAILALALGVWAGLAWFIREASRIESQSVGASMKGVKQVPQEALTGTREPAPPVTTSTTTSTLPKKTTARRRI